MRVATVLLTLLVLTGCSVSANPYAVHPDTIVALRSHTGKSVKLATFTSDKPGKSEIMCRGAAMIQTPGGVPFERYVEDAFRTELLVAGLASDTAPVTLTGHLERMHFETFAEAAWELQATLASSNGRRLTVYDRYGFNWHFVGDYACREAATAMALAVQSLVRKTVQHPEFAGLLEAGPTQAASATPAQGAPAPRHDLREWAPGQWRSTGGTNILFIERNLRWSWESAGGKFSGSGRGEVQGGKLVLQGWHSRSYPMTFHLSREGDTLVGELRTARHYSIIFVRE